MMASLKLYFRVSSVDPSRGSLIFRIIHKRRVCAISTGVKINAAEWDRAAETIIGARAAELLPKIEEVRTRIQTAIAILERAGGEYSVREIADRFYDTDSVTGVMSFIRLLIKECGEDGKQSAADHYRNLLGCMSAFLGANDVALEKVDTRFADRMENHMKKSGMCPNSTSYYMRKLRAVYNQAVERNLIPQLNPFRHVYTGVAKTEKRAVTLEVLNSLVGMELEHPSGACLARDMFLFSFYTRGMSTVDMAYLRKTDLRAGVLTYRRQKTSQPISIKWEPAMQRIVDRYADAESVYMLPLIKPGVKADVRRQYLSASHLLNRNLKLLGERLGLTTPLTMYVARHTWASIAQEQNIPLSVISQGMGHDSEKTTRIYLASLDRSRLDKANGRIIELVVGR